MEAARGVQPQEHPVDVGASGGASLKGAFWSDVRDQLRVKETLGEQERRHREEAVRLRADMVEQWGAMNFRERYLAGWFGGSKKKVKSYRELRGLLTDSELDAGKLRRRYAQLGDELAAAVSRHLAGTDAIYQELLRSRDALIVAQKGLHSCVTMLASDRFQHQGPMVTDRVVAAIRESATLFEAIIQGYRDFLRGYKLPAETDDEMAFLFHLVKAGFDPAVTPGHKYDDVSEWRRKAHARVEAMEEVINEHLRMASKAVTAYIDRAIADASR